MRRDGSEPHSLVEFSGPVYEGSVGRERLTYNHRLLHVPAGDGEEVIVGEWVFQGRELDTVHAKRLNVVNNRVRNLSLGVPPHVFRWLFDHTGEPRVVVTQSAGRVAYHWRAPGFDFNGHVVSETPGSRSLGVRVLTDAQATVWFDRRLAALQQEADRRLPGRINNLCCRRCDKPDMTVLVHGGPWVRGRSWQWEADAQFLASRGCVVIEPEFRGSTGYGSALYTGGWRQWGRAMQDDVADALTWAVAKGWVDKDRVCIAGASYGGYATLMGLIRHPEQYRCGVAWLAVTDPRLMYQWRAESDSSGEVREYSLPKLLGDPVKDAEMIASVTPVLHAGRIRAPLMLAFGGRDARVPLVHGNRMRDAMVEAGKPPAEWVVYGDEGHGWLKTETRVDFAARLEAFLARHLSPAAGR